MIHRLKRGQNDRGWPRYLFLRLYVKPEGFVLQNTKIPTVKYKQAAKYQINYQKELESSYLHTALAREPLVCLRRGEQGD